MPARTFSPAAALVLLDGDLQTVRQPAGVDDR